MSSRIIITSCLLGLKQDLTIPNANFASDMDRFGNIACFRDPRGLRKKCKSKKANDHHRTRQCKSFMTGEPVLCPRPQTLCSSTLALCQESLRTSLPELLGDQDRDAEMSLQIESLSAACHAYVRHTIAASIVTAIITISRTIIGNGRLSLVSS